MATTFIDYTGDGNATKSFSFPSIQVSDVKVEVDEVVKTSGVHYNITGYTTTGGGNVVFTSGNIPTSPSAIRIFRDTDVDSPKATYTAGSSIKAADLNDNQEQILFASQEEQNQTVITSRIKDGAVTTAKIKNDAITNAKIADDQIDSEHYVDGSIDTAHIADGNITTVKIAFENVTTDKIAANAVTAPKIADNAVVTDNIVNANVTTAKIADGNVTTAKIASQAVTNAKLAGLSVATPNIIDSNVTTAKIANSAVTTAKIADANVTSTKLATGAVTVGKLDQNSVRTADIIDANVTAAKLATGAVTTAKLDNNAVTSAKIATNAVTTDKIADSELSTLAGMQSTTASNLASSTALTATTAELNQLDGITLETSVTTNSNTRIPTSKAVNDLVLSVTNALGGFVAIANETSFPTTNPDPSNNAGTVVSISSLASGLAVNSSGVATIANGAGTGNTVTITGFPSSLHSQTLPASSGLNVQTTSTLHTYTFHKQLASAADIQAISATVNSFSNRYRVSASAPTSSLDGGDLWYDTTNSKLMVYSSQNSAWEESTAIGNFFICTISSSSATGGGSATPNGTAYRFTISNAPTSAQQLLVSVDGVIQKPNSGSSQPSEGYVLVGNDIIFGAAPANGASLFVTALGSAVGIGTPSNNTVTTAILQNGSVTTAKIVDANVTNAKLANGAVGTNKIASGAVGSSEIAAGSIVNSNISSSAAIDVSKLSGVLPLAGGTLVGNLAITREQPIVAFNDSTDNPDYYIGNIDGSFLIRDTTNNATRLTVNTDGHIDVAGNLDVGAGLDVTGNITVSGTVDGVDIAALNTTVGNITTDVVSDTTPQLGGDLQSNGNDIDFADNDKAIFGTDGDLEIYHSGSNSFIDESNGLGSLYIRTNACQIQKGAGSETMAQFFSDGAVNLFYDNSKKFETKNDGGTLIGTSTYSQWYLGTTDGTNRGAIYADNNNSVGFLSNAGSWAFRLNSAKEAHFYNHVYPNSNNSYDLGSTSYRWRNIYTNDLNLSNEGSSNDVDGTWGDWTIQEGESDLFLKNNRSGKKYKFNLTEVS